MGCLGPSGAKHVASAPDKAGRLPAIQAASAAPKDRAAMDMPDHTLPPETSTHALQTHERQAVPSHAYRPDLRRNANSIRVLLAALITLHALVVLYFAKDVVMPIVLGVLIALSLSPIARGLGRMGVPAPVTAVSLIATVGATAFTMLFTLGDQASDWLEQGPDLVDRVRIKLSGVVESVEAVRDATKEVEGLAASNAQSAPTVQLEQPGLVASAFSNLAGTSARIGVALVLAMFLLSSGTLFYEKLINSFASMKDKKHALRSVYDVEKSISRYLFTITVINLCLGLCVGTAAAAIGLPYAPVWGLVAFAFNFLPFLGTFVGTTLIAAVSIVTFDDLNYALLAPAAYLILGTIEGQFLTPMIVGRSLKINTVSVFLAVVFWAWLWGIAGALLAVPILVVVKVTCDSIPSLRGVGEFLSANSRPNMD